MNTKPGIYDTSREGDVAYKFVWKLYDCDLHFDVWAILKKDSPDHIFYTKVTQGAPNVVLVYGFVCG